MRNISPGLAAHLDGETTTVCRCWKITRRDNQVLGFTEHDSSVEFDGTTYNPTNGLDPTVTQTASGLAANSVEVIGALSSEKISSGDIRANKYDGAEVQVWVVNWSSPDENLLENVFHIGEISENDGVFSAELRSIESQLDQTKGEHFIRQCQANLGDLRCGVNLVTASFSANGVIVAYDGNRNITASGLSQFAGNWFQAGLLKFITGRNAGSEIKISQHLKLNTNTLIELWHQMPLQVDIGDTFEIAVGCDKEFETCKQKFSNALNFRGFPHLPGGDFAMTYASNSKNFDGGIIIK